MARRLRFNGTGSGVTGCPSVHEDLDSGEVIVHGPPLADPEDVAQLQHLSEGEVAIVVPRETLVDWTPKERTRQVETIDLDDFGALFGRFEHTAWRLETRGRYASDEAGDRWQQFVDTGSVGEDWAETPEVREFRDTISAQVAQGKRVERVRIVDQPRLSVSATSSKAPSGTSVSERTSATCGVPTRTDSSSPLRTSGCSTAASSRFSGSMTTTSSRTWTSSPNRRRWCAAP